MQAAAQLTIANATVPQLNSSSLLKASRLDSSSFTGSGSLTGRIGTLMARVFGCRHTELSRPVSRDGRAYRSCLNCGAQRQFNLGKWQMTGSFYYGQSQTHQISSV